MKNYTKYLSLFSITLFFIFLVMMFLWAFVLHPQRLDYAQKIKHFYKFNINDVASSQNLSGNFTYRVQKESYSSLEDTDDFNFMVENYGNNSQAFDKNVSTKNKIAIIIVNLGINEKVDELALNLPSQISFGILPYKNYVQYFVSQAKKTNHELYLNYQPSKADNSSNYYSTIFHQLLEDKEYKSRIKNFIDMFLEFNGFYLDYKILKEKDRYFSMLEELIKISSKKLILNHRSNAQYVGQEYLVLSDVILDENIDKDFINNKLKELVGLARAKGYAVGIANNFLISVETINSWVKSLDTQNIELVPISQIVYR